MASRLQDVILRGTRASQPVATTLAAGTLYFVTDEGKIERTNGTSWESYSGTSFPTLLQAPPGMDAEEPEYPQIIIPFIPPPAAAGGGGDAVRVRIALSEAELEAMDVTGIQLVAAPGADKIVVPISLSFEVIVTTAYGVNPSVTVLFDGQSPGLVQSLIGTVNPIMNSTGTKTKISGATDNNTYLYSSFDPRNKALKIFYESALGAGGVATAVANLLYAIHTTT